MSFLSGGSSPPAVAAAPEIPTESSAEVQAARRREAERIRKLKGRKSTILTGGQGAQDEKKTLLGA